MEHKYEVRFAKIDPETPPTMDEQIAIAREAAGSWASAVQGS
jgi:hypothetical protein